jgi:hypothetical protein
MGTTATVTRLLSLLLVLAWLGGCVQTKTTPGYARAGDNIIIGLGGIERNTGGEPALKASDLTVVLTDADGNEHELLPSYIFKSYLDYNAQMNTFTFDGTNASAGLTGMVPFDGGWFLVVPLIYPGQFNSPLPLAIGPATVSITSPKLDNTANFIEGDLDAIPIEIIEGTSTQDGEFVRQFVGYSPNPKNFVISPDNLSGLDAVGGGYLVINYNNDAFFKAGLEPMLVPSDHNPYVQLNYHVKPNGDGTGSIYVVLLNPAGFRTLATASPNSSLLSDLSVRLVYFSDGTPAQAKANFTLDSSSSYYIDMEGAVIDGILPTMTHAEDL